MEFKQEFYDIKDVPSDSLMIVLFNFEGIKNAWLGTKSDYERMIERYMEALWSGGPIEVFVGANKFVHFAVESHLQGTNFLVIPEQHREALEYWFPVITKSVILDNLRDIIDSRLELKESAKTIDHL